MELKAAMRSRLDVEANWPPRYSYCGFVRGFLKRRAPVPTAAELGMVLAGLADYEDGIACEIFGVVVAQMSRGMDEEHYVENNPKFTMGFTTVLVRKGPYQRIWIIKMLRHLQAGTFPLRGIDWTDQHKVVDGELADNLFEMRFMERADWHLRSTFFGQPWAERREEARLEAAQRAQLWKQWGHALLAQATEIAAEDAARSVDEKQEVLPSYRGREPAMLDPYVCLHRMWCTRRGQWIGAGFTRLPLWIRPNVGLAEHPTRWLSAAEAAATVVLCAEEMLDKVLDEVWEDMQVTLPWGWVPTYE